MLRTKLALLALVPSMILGYSACTGEVDTEEDEAVLEDEAAIASLPEGLVGTWRASTFAVGQIAALTLKSDGTYHRGRVVACLVAPCPSPEDDGQYTVGYRGTTTYMTLTPAVRDPEPERFEFVMRGDAMRISRLGTSQTWTTLWKSESAAWCAVDHDCALQDLPVGPCATDWYCTPRNICEYSCRPTEPAEIE